MELGWCSKRKRSSPALGADDDDCQASGPDQATTECTREVPPEVLDMPCMCGYIHVDFVLSSPTFSLQSDVPIVRVKASPVIRTVSQGTTAQSVTASPGQTHCANPCSAVRPLRFSPTQEGAALGAEQPSGIPRVPSAGAANQRIFAVGWNPTRLGEMLARRRCWSRRRPGRQIDSDRPSQASRYARVK